MGLFAAVLLGIGLSVVVVELADAIERVANRD